MGADSSKEDNGLPDNSQPLDNSQITEAGGGDEGSQKSGTGSNKGKKVTFGGEEEGSNHGGGEQKKSKYLNIPVIEGK